MKLLDGMDTELPHEMVAVIVCSRMQWTYDQYQQQPVWFIKTLLMKWGMDAAKKAPLNRN